MSSSGVNVSPPTPAAAGATPDDAAAVDIRAAAKWLIATAGAVLAVLLAGVGLADLRSADGVGLLIAGAGVCVALVATGVLIVKAATVLVARAPSIQEIAERESKDPGAVAGMQLDAPSDPLVAYLLSRRLELLGPTRDSIAALIVEGAAVERGLRSGQVVDIDGRTYRPGAVGADRASLMEMRADVASTFSALVDAADRWTVDGKFRSLRRAFICAGISFLLGMSAFMAVTIGADPRVEVTKPTVVRILVPASAAGAMDAGFPAECQGLSLSGVAVAGWLDQPTVVTEPKGNCSAMRVQPGDTALVLPAAE
jgi:hypothetical protein